MLSFFQTIAHTIAKVIQIVIYYFTSLVEFIIHIPQYVSFLTDSIAWLPATILPFAIASISISIMLFVLNRQR